MQCVVDPGGNLDKKNALTKNPLVPNDDPTNARLLCMAVLAPPKLHVRMYVRTYIRVYACSYHGGCEAASASGFG